MSGDDLTYPAQAYRAAIAFGMKKQEEKLGLMAENARLRRELDGEIEASQALAGENIRLRADLERLAVETMGITAAGARAYEEAERLRVRNTELERLHADEMKEATGAILEVERLREHHDKLHTICIWDSARDA